jgi:flavin-dependent dehydrogenase
VADRQLSVAERRAAPDIDVAVVGGGPAGCAAAITLRRYLPEVRVLLVAAPPQRGRGVGETFSPGIQPLLGYLGLRERFARCEHLPAGGTASAWGSPVAIERSYLFTGRGLGWHVDRARFDRWLLDHVRTAGAEVLVGRARLARTSETSSPAVDVAGAGTITARAVVDATGRPAALVRQTDGPPRRDDALVAEIRWYDGGRDERTAAGALIESFADGWWYSASLPGCGGVAMFMTDADLRKEASWDARLASAPATAARLERWRETGETAVRAAHSQLTPRVAARGYIAAGDAAAAFDPISSLGIGFSLRSGMEAARVAASAIEVGTTDPAVAAAYTDSIERIYADYRARHRAIYAVERRWCDAPFWVRRTADIG